MPGGWMSLAAMCSRRSALLVLSMFLQGQGRGQKPGSACVHEVQRKYPSASAPLTPSELSQRCRSVSELFLVRHDDSCLAPGGPATIQHCEPQKQQHAAVPMRLSWIIRIDSEVLLLSACPSALAAHSQQQNR